MAAPVVIPVILTKRTLWVIGESHELAYRLKTQRSMAKNGIKKGGAPTPPIM